MNDKIKEILNKIEDKGFKAYVVGGYVRDFLRKVKSSDVDICTNARVKDLIEKPFSKEKLLYTAQRIQQIKINLK